MPCRKLSSTAVVCACLALAVAATADEVQQALDSQRNLNAIQSIYRAGVPHTDKTGRLMLKYDPQKSFFQVGSWGVPLPGQGLRVSIRLERIEGCRLQHRVDLGRSAKASLEAGSKYGMQIIVMGEISDADLAAVKTAPNLLGNVWTDEPIGALERLRSTPCSPVLRPIETR